jgi:hypothetical protein
MPDENPNPAPENQNAPAIPEWKQAFGAEAVPVLESFKEPGDFLKSFQDLSGELKTFKEKPAADWRKEVAGEDEKALKLLERFSSGKDFGKAYQEAMNKIRSGELAKPLAKDAKPEEVAAWRQANGIPEKPEAYFEKLPNGRVIGQDDQPLFNEVAGKLHTHNVPPAAMHDLVEWYYGLQDKESATISESDKRDAQAAEDALRKAWGDDFRANENHLGNYLAGLPEGLQKAFNEGFGGDGRKLMHNPEFKQWLSNIAREFTPVGFVTPGGNDTTMATLDEEIAKLSAMSAKTPKEYWGTKNEARHKQLITQRDALKKRMAA